jgi:hypothetical protein
MRLPPFLGPYSTGLVLWFLSSIMGVVPNPVHRQIVETPGLS